MPAKEQFSTAVFGLVGGPVRSSLVRPDEVDDLVTARGETLGQIATDEQRLDAALMHFSAALQTGPQKQKVTYVLHNNIAYCLNQLGRFIDGERHCRLAIETDWNRASAYRNLGLSMQGQGKTVEAAWALVEAMKSDSTDNRARGILQKLIAQNPNMVVQYPWITQCLYPDSQASADQPLM